MWKIIEKNTNKFYAMKEISKVKTYLDGNVESLISEFNILKKLHYSLLSNLYYAYQDKENIFLILDFLPGGTLRSHLPESNTKKSIFSEIQIKFLLSNIILSLEYIHNNGIIHRDLKPENLLFDDEGYLHLTDFGISKIYYPEKSKILDVSGTPGYISPEMIRGEPQNFVSDFFAMGIVAYELIFGKRPFEGNNKDEIAENILNKNINLNEDNMRKNFSIDAADFVNRLLKKKNKQRLGSRGIDEIKSHKWLEDVDWTSVEYKNIDTKDIGIIKILNKYNGKNKDIEDIDFKSQIDRYNSILNKINKENIFKNFYFKFDENEKNDNNDDFVDNLNENDDYLN